MKESCHVSMSLSTCHISLSRGTHTNESWHTYQWIMSRINWSRNESMSHATNLNASCQMSIGLAPYINESCYTYEWVVSLINASCHTSMGHVKHLKRKIKHINAACRKRIHVSHHVPMCHITYQSIMLHICMRHVTHIIESCHTN